MKNIKVNIINYNGKPSSTTINYAICEMYYEMITSPDDQVKHYKQYGYDVRKEISLCVQTYTNKFILTQAEKQISGVSQYTIERSLLRLIAGRDYSIG